MEQKLNIGIEQTSAVECEECGGIYFTEAVHIRKVIAFLSGTGKPQYIPIPVFRCTECGHINSEFLPKEVKDLRN